MDIKGKTILILGGWGLVGQLICRRLIPEKPGRMIGWIFEREESGFGMN